MLPVDGLVDRPARIIHRIGQLARGEHAFANVLLKGAVLRKRVARILVRVKYADNFLETLRDPYRLC